MPPKRKTASQTKTSPSPQEEVMVTLSAGCQPVWQLEDEKKALWEVFSPEVTEGLTGAAMSGKISVSVKAGPRTQLTLDLVNMVQRTKQGLEKRIRGLVTGSGGSLVGWEVRVGEVWQGLQVGVVAKLEQVADISSEVVVGGFKYDLVEMTRSGVLDGVDKEEVRRVKQEVGSFKKSGVTGKIVLDEKDVEDDEDESRPAKKSKQETKKSTSSGGGDETKSVMKSMIRKGLAPVDGDCPHQSSHHVYCEGSTVWDAMLNQTNIQSNNNKYYLIQLLKTDSGNNYAVWMRWGRVGYKGQNSWTTCGSDLNKAKNVFQKKFMDKTYNSWENRDSFEKCAGKYDLVKMDYCNNPSVKDEVDTPIATNIKPEPETKPSTLSKAVQELVSLICNLETMEQAVTEMQYDTRKAPLGKVTTEQISAGYSALRRIADCVKEGKNSGPVLVQACNDFYTRIPHEFGFKTPPLIKTKEEVKVKLQLLEALADIQVALKMLSGVSDDGLHPADRSYRQLGLQIRQVGEGEERRMVENSIQSTHASTHSLYSMEVMEMFALDKEKETKEFKDLGNKKLLFHGSRLSNWAGILGQGLRIAPPEAPSTGYMFGKGVYFADMSSKSANYCFTTRSQPVGLLMLCEVSLGNPNKLVAADYNADKLPKGTHSTMGQGRVEPTSFTPLPGGLELPMGPPRNTKVTNNRGYTLNYNEFIVYDTKQIKMKYLAKIKFNYKL